MEFCASSTQAGVCVFFAFEPFFLPPDIQHDQCPCCDFLISERYYGSSALHWHCTAAVGSRQCNDMPSYWTRQAKYNGAINLNSTINNDSTIITINTIENREERKKKSKTNKNKMENNQNKGRRMWEHADPNPRRYTPPRSRCKKNQSVGISLRIDKTTINNNNQAFFQVFYLVMVYPPRILLSKESGVRKREAFVCFSRAPDRKQKHKEAKAKKQLERRKSGVCGEVLNRWHV